MKIRCSSIHKIIGEPKSKAEKEANGLTQTAKSYVIERLKNEYSGFESFTGSKETEKGLLLEDEAIRCSGLIRGLMCKKNTERRVNDWITGECDIYDPKRKTIIDTKCSWDIGTHPFFQEEAEAKAEKAGYGWQMQGYMWLFDCEKADIDFWIFPTPEELLKPYDDVGNLVEAVERLPFEKRLTTITVYRDENAINQIKRKAEACFEYAEKLKQEFEKGKQC